jgi:hypothetical protein
MISKSLSTSEKFASLTESAGALAEFCQLLYPLIVAHADDFGRLQGDTFTIKHMCFPSSPRSVEEFSTALAHLHAVGMIMRYEVSAKRFIQIANFDSHQLGLHKRTKSTFPGIPGDSVEFPGVPAQENLTELNLTEQKGTEEKKEKAAASPPRVRQHREDPTKNFTVITKIAHETLDVAGLHADLGDLAEGVKGLCARRGIDYSGEVVRKAVDAALHHRRAH